MVDWKILIKPHYHLLDVGCWTGKRIRELKDLCTVYGMDINKSRFPDAAESIRDKLKYGDVTKAIPFKKKFDFILFMEVLEHIEKEDASLSNLSNSLREGGRLVLSTPHHISFLNFWDPAWIKWKLFGGERHKHYTKDELFNKLKEHNLIVEDYGIEGGLGWLFVRWLNVFFKHVLKSKKQFITKKDKGYFDWIIIAKKKSVTTNGLE